MSSKAMSVLVSGSKQPVMRSFSSSASFSRASRSFSLAMKQMNSSVCVCVCARARACVRACVRACIQVSGRVIYTCPTPQEEHSQETLPSNTATTTLKRTTPQMKM